MKIRASKETVWLFDYDLTLYTYKERFVLDSLDRHIMLFVKRFFDCSEARATEIRKDYLVRFGTTLRGLQVLHGVDPNEYYDFIHQREGLIYPEFAPRKRDLLERLPGEKFIFTNGRRDWSEAGLRSMGILDVFRGILDVADMNWLGKPAESAYACAEDFLKREFGAVPKSVIMLDDAAKNLPGGAAHGWTTVLVNPVLPAGFEGFHVDSLFELPELVEELC